MKKYFIYSKPFIYALPSVLIGIVVMYLQGISATIYMQNLVFLILGSIIACIYIKQRFTVKNTYETIIVCILILCSTFISAGIENIHRWISIGPLRLNVAFIFLPILLISINKLIEIDKQNISYICMIAVVIILLLQPDASMTTAFSGALIPIICSNYKSKVNAGIVLSILFIFVVISWLNLDSLPAVSYVENIIILAKESGWIYLLFSVFSFFIMLVPFAIINIQKSNIVISMSLGSFFIIVILCTIFGNFPVPLMGYGISPIIGYMLAVAHMQK